jgi:hypothetical protein
VSRLLVVEAVAVAVMADLKVRHAGTIEQTEDWMADGQLLFLP